MIDWLTRIGVGLALAGMLWFAWRDERDSESGDR